MLWSNTWKLRAASPPALIIVVWKIMSTITCAVTAEELIRLPDNGLRYELVKGEIVRMAPAGSNHGEIAMRLGWRLAKFVEENGLGKVFAAETGFKIASDPDTVRAPDAAFVSKARVEQAGAGGGYWSGAPDLAVEVVSPSDTYTEVEEKVIDWLDAGACMVIVVNPRKRSVSVYRGLAARLLTENDTLSGEEVVPGWSVAVKDLFAQG